MDEYLTMADGTTVEDAYIVSLGEDNIAVYAKSIHSVRDAWKIFGSAKKTKAIHSYQYGDEADWEGFTEPEAVQIMPDSTAQICLTRGLKNV